MARKKRSSRIIEKAEKRLSGIASIDPHLDLGNGLTIASYRQRINQTRQNLADYNMRLSQADGAQNKVEESERELSRLSEQMLLGVALRYGRDSNEYEVAGGKPRRRKKLTNQTEASASELELKLDSQLVNGNQPVVN